MKVLLQWVIAALFVASTLGCCASTCRHYQNAYGFNFPVPDRYSPGPPPPRTTPPGPLAPASLPVPASVMPRGV